MKTRAASWLILLSFFLGHLQAAEKRPAKATAADAAVAAIGSTTEPGEALAKVARSHRIPLAEIDRFRDGTNVNAGDSITALVTLVEKSRKTQWLLYVKADEEKEDLAPSEAAPSKVATNKPSKTVMYSSTGRKLEFESRRVPVTLRTLGPYQVSGSRGKLKPADKTAQLKLNEGYLALGLDKAATAIMRLQNTKPKGVIAFAPRPFSDKEIAATRQRTNTVHLSADEERALAGAAPALESFFDLVQRTEGLSDIMQELVDLPSMWSIVRNGGVTVNFRFVNAVKQREAVAGKPSVYEMPLALELNGQPALNITMVITSPQPPLLACAGIRGLVATRPGAKDTFLAVQVISAKHSGSAPNGVLSE